MAVRIIEDKEQGYSCMYCSTTMWAFGGVFRKGEDINKFLEWLCLDPRELSDKELDEKINDWRLFLNIQQ